MTIEQLKNAWNAKADGWNQWHELGLDEKIEFAQQIERERCAEICDSSRKNTAYDEASDALEEAAALIRGE